VVVSVARLNLERDEHMNDYDDPPVTCPSCGKIDDIDGFDILGADEGCIFCTDCSTQFHASTGAVILPANEVDK
jgi:hypothetical protein